VRFFFLPLANKKGVRGVSSMFGGEVDASGTYHQNNRFPSFNATPWICTKANVEENSTPPNDAENISDGIETITDDIDTSGNIVPKVSPRTISNSALTSFEEKSSSAMNRYVYTESPD
jgi:hypothetical protein